MTRRMRPRPASLLLSLTFCLCASAQTPAPDARRTVLDGVYTAAQASRGDGIYAANCARCHEGADVDGPPLTGTPFVDRWREDTLSTLFTFMKSKMPQDSPGKLSEAQYVDVLTHLLDANTFPAGPNELTATTMSTTLFVGKDGPKPLPSNALVRVTGCLTSGQNHTWTLTSAGSLARTRTGEQSVDDLKGGASRPLGAATFRLQNIDDLQPAFDADANKGHKVLVNGVLVHQTAMDRINVTAIASLNTACAP